MRDVKGAFDNVWHLGLKLKIDRLLLPAEITRLLSDFLEDRTFQVRVGSHLGPSFPILSGVPQGSNLSPTLYNLYISDISDPLNDCHQFIYADDITQVVTSPWRSREILADRTAADIERVNRFEKEWKIQTNQRKFKVVPIAQRCPEPLVVEGDIQPYSSHAKMLGLTIGRFSYKQHVSERSAQAKANLSKLRRFQNLPLNKRKLLYTAFIRPILEYPPIPLAAVSTHQQLRLQRVQNRAVSFITRRDWTLHETMESLHRSLKLPAMNRILQIRASDTWKRVQFHYPEEFEWLSQPIRGED